MRGAAGGARTVGRRDKSRGRWMVAKGFRRCLLCISDRMEAGEETARFL